MSSIPVMTFDGVDMSRFFRIYDIIKPIGNSRDVSLSDAPDLGVNIQRISRGAKEHTIKFTMFSSGPFEIEQLKHELAGIFDTDGVVEIKYGDEPDKYYLGMVIDDITPDNITRWIQSGEIKIIIPDGVSHATTYTPIDVSKATVTGNKAVIDVVNNGNQPALPIFTFNHISENGYIGIVNQSGALEFGDIGEVDGYDKKKSKILRDYKTGTNIISGLSHAQKNVAVLNDTSQTLNGTLAILNLWGRPHMHLSNRGGTSGNNGGSVTWTIPADENGEVGALNDYIWWRQIFWAGHTNQRGFIKVTVSDAEGRFLYGVETFKRSNSLTCEYNFLGADDEGGYDVLDRWRFKATEKNTENPFNKDRGFCDLLRRDDVVQVYFWGKYKKIKVPAIKGRKGVKIHVTFGSMGSAPIPTHMYLDQIYYRKDFIEYFDDIPNLMSSGSSLVLNVENKTAHLDGQVAAGEVVHTPNWVRIPPGKSKLEVYWSEWADKPEFDFKFEERNI